MAQWPPPIPPGPKAWVDFFQAIINRVDAITPKDGHGNKVSDAAGGGKSINSDSSGGNSGVPLKDCVFYDPEGGEEETGEFFKADVLITGKKTPIPPPAEP